MSSFVHLHVHTEYSLLDGMSRVKDLAAHTKELGMNAVAITDHGAMYGVIEFYRACKEMGVKPIIGIEAYLSPRRMGDRDPVEDKNYTHLLLIAQNKSGYQNLLKIASASQLEGFYYKPRIDKDFLAAHADGLICTSGCLAAEVPQMLLQGREKEARRMLGWYQDVFGAENFYIELQDHDIPDLHKVNQALHEIAPYANIPYLATNDVHYVRRKDAGSHDVLLCIGTGNLVNEPNRLKFSDDSYYLRSPDEMMAIFAQVPEALSNTVKVAEMCDVNLDDKEYHLPVFDVPEGFTAESYLRHLCYDGLRERYGELADDQIVQERLEHELRIIHGMGFDTYFLIVWDLCQFAKSRDIWWNVRGSGAGSLVAYSLKITNLDPLSNGLIFERFLNPGRVSMPDIDIDYPDDRRAEMIEYCVHKYGEDKVAQIITFGTLGARAALRDVGRTLDIPLTEVDQLARLIPAIPGKPVTIHQAIDQVPELKQAYEDANRPYIQQLIDTAARLEGISRHASTHAAGVLIADKPLVEYTPLNRPTNQGDGLGAVSQWPMEIVESIGLLKVDFLGLRTLTIMRKACELIEQYHGVHYDLDTIPYRHREDEGHEAQQHNEMLDQAFHILQSGTTSGVFQVEGAGMTRMLTEMKPSRFEHIIAAISLFRPGPIDYIPTFIRRMHGEETVAYHHPLLEPILEETYGIIVYQEQIMQIASSLFGYGMGEADLMRRAVSKKKAKDLEKHKAHFVRRGPDQGVSAEVAQQIFDDIEFFANYGFNKSHAADYAVLTVQTAFLKAHYPHEFMTALLTIERNDTEKVGQYINECRKLGIGVLPPHINASDKDFTIEIQGETDRAIRYGLSAIKNVGEGSVEAVLRARSGKPFRNASDFCRRVDLREVGKRALESLIKVGALEELADRLQLLESIDRMMNVSGTEHKAADAGQLSLFGDTTGVSIDMTGNSVLVDQSTMEVSPREMLQWERELVGVYISEHPLQRLSSRISSTISVYSTQITESDHGRLVTMAGMVTYVRRHLTKTGKVMAFAGLEDLLGQIEIVIWPSTWDETQHIWEPDRILLVRGKLDTQRGKVTLLCEEATTNLEIFEAAGSGNSGSPKWEAGFGSGSGDEEFYPPADAEVTTHVEPPDDLPSDSDFAIHDEHELGKQHGSILVDRQEADQSENVPGRSLPPDDESTSPPVVSPTPSISASPAKLRFRIPRSGDVERDKRRVRHLHGLLISQPGQDRFSIALEGSNGRLVEVDFPDDTTDYATIESELIAFLGGPEGIDLSRL